MTGRLLGAVEFTAFNQSDPGNIEAVAEQLAEGLSRGHRAEPAVASSQAVGR